MNPASVAHALASSNQPIPGTSHLPILTTDAPSISTSDASVAASSSTAVSSIPMQQKSMSTTNLQDSDQQSTANAPSIAATTQASSAETIGQLKRQSPSLENLLSRARLFVGTTTGLSQDRIPESGKIYCLYYHICLVPENDALTDYESSLDAHSTNDLDEQNPSSRQ
jgi:hypothetical protein